ncbi:hypothetical protein AB0H51_11370 [Streptomyces griseoluteus]|uniref:hypothetical protein n=1 Tax=Streptomyces griseoluteus TaxID=29306 RepID=UPI0033E05740
MTTYNITAPEPQFNGEIAGVMFREGRATVDGDHENASAALAYFRRRGYGVDGGEPTVAEEEPFEPADPRTVAEVQGGSLRDGAVEPRATDAGLPTNAGVDNPHGPRVVSPEAPTPPGQVIETEAAAVEGGQQRPARSASKAEWQAYARTRAQDSGEEAAIDGMTKEELVAKYGGGS